MTIVGSPNDWLVPGRAASKLSLSRCIPVNATSAQATAGVRLPHNQRSGGSVGSASASKIRCLSLAAGWRRHQERKRFSVRFNLLISHSIQL